MDRSPLSATESHYAATEDHPSLSGCHALPRQLDLPVVPDTTGFVIPPVRRVRMGPESFHCPSQFPSFAAPASGSPIVIFNDAPPSLSLLREDPIERIGEAQQSHEGRCGLPTPSEQIDTTP